GAVTFDAPVRQDDSGQGSRRRPFAIANVHAFDLLRTWTRRPRRYCVSGTMVLPRASVATSAAIFRARPAGVFIALVRNASANGFSLLGLRKVRVARGFVSMAARRSRGTVDAVVARIGA